MVASERLPPLMSVADFLAWPGDGNANRHRLVDGEVRAMSPGSAIHGRIQSAATALLERHPTASGSPCRPVTKPAVLPLLRADRNLRVPDLGVTCSPIERGRIALPDPILLIEILSPGNEARLGACLHPERAGDPGRARDPYRRRAVAARPRPVLARKATGDRARWRAAAREHRSDLRLAALYAGTYLA